MCVPEKKIFFTMFVFLISLQTTSFYQVIPRSLSKHIFDHLDPESGGKFHHLTLGMSYHHHHLQFFILLELIIIVLLLPGNIMQVKVLSFLA
jgi:hypothetical protein